MKKVIIAANNAETETETIMLSDEEAVSIEANFCHYCPWGGEGCTLYCPRGFNYEGQPSSLDPELREIIELRD